MLQGKNSYNCAKTDAQRSTTGWSSTQNNIKIANHVVSGVFGWLRNKRSGIHFLTRGWEYGFKCVGGLQVIYTAFQSSVVLVAFHHRCLTCPAYPPFRCFLDCCRISSSALVLVILLSYMYVLGSVSC